MQLGERTSDFLKLLVPLLIVALLGISPVSHPVAEKLQAAHVARETGQHQAAAEALRQAAIREPWRVELWEEIGQEEYAAGRMEQAAQALQTASARGTLSADGRFLLGEVYWQLRDPGSAQAAWQALIEGGHASPRMFERLAQLHRAQGDFTAAVDTLRGWRAAFPGDAKAAYSLGLHLCAVQPAEALPPLLDASRIDSGYTSAVQTLRADLALAENADKDQPAYAWLLIGRSLASIRQWDLAQETFEKAVTISPEYADAWAFLGEARAQLGGSGKAELEKARSLDPESVLVKALSAIALRRQGDHNGALSYLREIVKQEPQEPAWQVEIGKTVAKIGDLSEAYRYFQRAIELAPENPHYWLEMVAFSTEYYYDVRGIGLPAARRAVQLAPNDPGAQDAMGVAMYRLGDSASAERFLQRALEQDADYAPANLHLGQLYLQRQNDRDAYFYLKIAARLDADGSTGEKARRLLRQYFGEGS